VELTRRELLLGGLAPFVTRIAPAPVDTTPAWAKSYGLTIAPRASWVPETAPAVTGLAVESTVAVLVVHHSETSNSYLVEDVPKVLRSFRAYHVSKKKGWPDVAYNFFVDRFGGVWEGRTGSLDAPVVGSASGGNQGSSQLVCLVGHHSVAPPSDAAVGSLVRLLAALADRYDMPRGAETTTEFVSRGSSRWPVDEIIRTRTIEGHRAMSMTSCPGDAAFHLLPSVRASVDATRMAVRPAG
jgi:N-acetylmuramoyl-L-alanine amidase